MVNDHFPYFSWPFLAPHARSMARGAGVAPRPGAGRNLGGGATGWHHAGLLWLGSEGPGRFLGADWW